MEIYFKDVITIPIVQAGINCAYDTYYWVGWPNEDNPWVHPCCWWQSFIMVVAGYPSPKAGGKWVGGLRPRRIEYTTVYFTKDTPEFRGIDLAWYGPFKAGEAARVPIDDAEYWIRMGYASYTPPPPKITGLEEIPKALASIRTDISDLKSSITSLSESIAGLSGQFSGLIAAVAIEGIAIIILAIALILLMRRKPTSK